MTPARYIEVVHGEKKVKKGRKLLEKIDEPVKHFLEEDEWIDSTNTVRKAWIKKSKPPPHQRTKNHKKLLPDEHIVLNKVKQGRVQLQRQKKPVGRTYVEEDEWISEGYTVRKGFYRVKRPPHMPRAHPKKLEENEYIVDVELPPPKPGDPPLKVKRVRRRKPGKKPPPKSYKIIEEDEFIDEKHYVRKEWKKTVEAHGEEFTQPPCRKNAKILMEDEYICTKTHRVKRGRRLVQHLKKPHRLHMESDEYIDSHYFVRKMFKRTVPPHHKIVKGTSKQRKVFEFWHPESKPDNQKQHGHRHGASQVMFVCELCMRRQDAGDRRKVCVIRACSAVG